MLKNSWSRLLSVMKIRSATINDLEKIARAHKASIRELCRNAYDVESIEKWTAILVPKIYENAIKEKVVIVAEEKNEIPGFGILDVRNAELSALYVHPGYAGRGIGKEILSRLEAIALENRIGRLNLCSTINAFGFYQHHGYIECGKTFHDLPNGAKLECIKMYKPISKPRQQK